MFGIGISELIILALVAIPGLAFIAAPIVVAVTLWKGQNDLRARVARLEAALTRHGLAP
jgi:hypothetical protein